MIKKSSKLFLTSLAILFAGNQMTYAAHSSWPALPNEAFISGRPANEKDVADGKAIFVAKVGSTLIGKPLPVRVPQYAYWKDGKGEKMLVVVVQAEEANGMQLFGFRDSSGANHVATGPEMELLGTTPPR